MFPRPGEGWGGQFDIGLRRQAWGERSLLSALVKEMTSVPGVHALEVTAMNHVLGQTPDVSVGVQHSLPYSHEPPPTPIYPSPCLGQGHAVDRYGSVCPEQQHP